MILLGNEMRAIYSLMEAMVKPKEWVKNYVYGRNAS